MLFPLRVPLMTLMIIQKPYDRVALDTVGPFLKSAVGCQFVLLDTMPPDTAMPLL